MSIFNRDTDPETTEHVLCELGHDHPADGVRDGRAICSAHAVEAGRRLTLAETFMLHQHQMRWNAL